MATTHPLTLTVEQAGAVLGIGRTTAYDLVRTGDLHSIRLRRRIVIPTAFLADRLGVSSEDIAAVVSAPSPTSRPASSGDECPVAQRLEGSVGAADCAPTLF